MQQTDRTKVFHHVDSKILFDLLILLFKGGREEKMTYVTRFNMRDEDIEVIGEMADVDGNQAIFHNFYRYETLNYTVINWHTPRT